MSQTVASALQNKVVTFVSDIDNIFNCVICMQVADEPVRCSGMCAGVFCNGCMQQALTRRSHCPTCDILTSNVPLRDVVLRVQIMNNQVFCLNDGTDILTTRSTRKRKVADKCTWIGKYDQLAAHLNQCDFELVRCTNNGCTAKIERYKLMEHSQVCIHRMANCGHCNIVVKAAAMLNHLRQCLKVDVACECGFECLRDALTAHQDKDCPLAKIQCDVIGCDAKMTRGDYDKHQEQAATQHVRLLSAALGEGKQENARLALEVGIMKQDIERLSAALQKIIVISQQFKWRLSDVAKLLTLAISEEKAFQSPRFDIGSHKLFIRAIIQGGRLALYIHKDVTMSVDKTRFDLNGCSFSVTKAGMPNMKRIFALGDFLEPPEWKGRGFRSFLADMTLYIDKNDGVDITTELKTIR